MIRKISLILLLLLPFLGKTQTASTYQKICEFADSIQFLELDNFLFNRQPVHVPKVAQEHFNRYLKWVDSLTIQEVNDLLTDKKPEVRALALLALYQFERLESLSVYAAMVKDTAFCFKANPFEHRARIPTYSMLQIKHLIGQAPYLRVADIAKRLLIHFYKQSGYDYAETDLYLKEREALEHTAGFLTILKYRATGGIQPLDTNRRPLVEKLTARINAIQPDLDRSIYKIYLSAEDHLFSSHAQYVLYSEAEMVRALKNIGKQKAMAILKRKAPIHDPDLQKAASWLYTQLCQWILMHAEVLFTEKDVPSLLALAEPPANNHGPMNIVELYVAAARLDSSNAATYLKLGLSRFKHPFLVFQRAQLYAELWHLCGEQESDFILDWLFGCYRLNEHPAERTETFVGYLDQRGDIELIKKIIQDARFEDSMHIWTIRYLAQQINKIKQKELVPLKLIEAIWHPYGLDRAEWWRDRAWNEYPKETKNMLENTDKLKKALRQLVVGQK